MIPEIHQEIGRGPSRVSPVRCRNPLFSKATEQCTKHLYPRGRGFSRVSCSLCIAKSGKSRFLPHSPLARGIHRDVDSTHVEGAVTSMRIAETQPLFAWAALEDSPSLGTIRR